MRDPLRNVSVRYKLAITFIGVCLLAFGVGGYLVSRSAMSALEREILSRLQFQSEAYATALEGDLRALAQRARDFASDGFIRAQFDTLAAEPDGAVPSAADDLRAHILRNKLPIVPAFQGLALASASGESFFLAQPADADWTRQLGPSAFAGNDWCSGFLTSSAPDQPPTVVLGTPLMSLGGDRRIGTLLVALHPSVWVASAVGAMRGADSELSVPTLRLVDGAGRSLVVPPVLLARPTPPIAGEIVRSGFGLRIGKPARESANSSPPARGVFSRRLAIGNHGWFVETELSTLR